MALLPANLTTSMQPPQPEPSPIDALAHSVTAMAINTTKPSIQAPTWSERVYCIPAFFREADGDAKYYVICVGRKTGVFNNWETVGGLVKGYPNNKHKSFVAWSDAYEYWREHCHHHHYHGFSEVGTLPATSGPLPTSTTPACPISRPTSAQPCDDLATTISTGDAVPDLVATSSGIRAEDCSDHGVLYIRGKAKQEQDRMFALRAGSSGIIYCDKDAAEAAFKKARQGGGDAQLKCTDIFDDAVEFITKPQDS